MGYGDTTYSATDPPIIRNTLGDFVQELKDRGFDGLGDERLTKIVNRAYLAVARKSQWYWEEATDEFTMVPGTGFVDLWPLAGGELPYFRSLDKLYVITEGHRRRLKPIAKEKFFTDWLSLDLSASSSRGEPDSYYMWQGQLYVLPPPSAERTFVAHYHRRVAAMSVLSETPITPPHLDEAIMLAALVRAHEQSNEPELAVIAKSDLQEVFDDMEDDEQYLLAEEPSRTSPDDTWL